MTSAFKKTIKANFPYLIEAKLLVAVSAGVDSVILAHLCKEAKLNFSIAHCNFNLRDEESDADEEFVIELADKLEVEILTQNFDTKLFASESGKSIQMAARDLRYDWFEEIRSKLKFDYLLTAHHANDNLETFLINLVRGSGLEGFTGMKPRNNKIIRPLLEFSRQEIEDFAVENKIQWREDSSNASNKYLRNRIRHQIVPVLLEANPQFLASFAKTQDHLSDSLGLVDDYINLLYSEIVTKTRFGYDLKVSALKKTSNPKAVLYELLKTFGFTEWDDVASLLNAQPGKIVYSPNFRLIKDREVLILTELYNGEDKEYLLNANEENILLPMGHFSVHPVPKMGEMVDNCLYVALEKIKFPLTLRKWKTGDHFYPYGMKGKKKISDFFKDKKLSLPEKEETWLLCSGEDIIWVVNYRADERFAIKNLNEPILKITYSL